MSARLRRPSFGEPTRLACAAAALAALALLAGCASLPGSGPVTAGQSAPADIDDDFAFLPNAPALDAEPEQIVQGFIDAASSSQNDYSVARLYLADELAQSWEPDAGVIVAGSRPRVEAVGTREYRISVTAVARVDATGHYQESSSSEPVTLEYRVGEESGQWRVTQAPDGIVLPESTFRQTFTAQPLYFFEPSFRYLVPDLRWFPLGTSTPTRIVTALLAGPSEWLSSGTLVSAFPEGSQLSVNAVTVESSRAVVDLTSVPSNARDLQRMRAQLEESLSGLSSISSVVISVDQNALQIPDPDGQVPVRDPLLSDARPLVQLDSGTLGFLSEGELDPPTEALGAGILALSPFTAASVVGAREAAAVLTEQGTWIVDEGEALLVDERRRQVAPVLDTWGWAWTASRAEGAAVRVSNGELTSAVAAPWLEGVSVRAIALSRDGARVAIVTESGGQFQLSVAGVVRDAEEHPVSLGTPLRLRSGGTPIVDVTWTDALTVAALTGSSEARLVVSDQIGGVSAELGAVPGATRLVGGEGANALRALTSEGELLVRSGNTWQRLAGGVALLAVVR